MESRGHILARQSAQTAGNIYGQTAVEILTKTLTDEQVANPDNVARYVAAAEREFRAKAIAAYPFPAAPLQVPSEDVPPTPVHTEMAVFWYNAALAAFSAALKQRNRLIPQDVKDAARFL